MGQIPHRPIRGRTVQRREGLPNKADKGTQGCSRIAPNFPAFAHLLTPKKLNEYDSFILAKINKIQGDIDMPLSCWPHRSLLYLSRMITYTTIPFFRHALQLQNHTTVCYT